MQMEATLHVAGGKAATRPEFARILGRVRKLRSEIDARALAPKKPNGCRPKQWRRCATRMFSVPCSPSASAATSMAPRSLHRSASSSVAPAEAPAGVGRLAVCFGWMTAFFPLEAQQEVWDDPDNLLAVSYMPTPKVEVVDGGYRISGSWPWASGVNSAAWLILAALLPGTGAPPTLAWCLVPVSDVVVDHDSWNVSGLEGTGSKTVAISILSLCRSIACCQSAPSFPGKCRASMCRGNHQARFGYPTFGPTALVSPIVGMAQGALDAFTGTARDARRMARPGVFEKVAESPLIQSLVGQAAARIDAAQTLMLTSLSGGQEIVRAGGTLDIEQRVRIRRNHGFAARTSAEVVNEIFFKCRAQPLRKE